MGNAVWLFWAVPAWFFSAILTPFSGGIFSAIPAVGALCLAIGTIWGILRREAKLLIFLLLVIASQALVVVASFMRGSLRGAATGEPILATFILLQIAIGGYLVWRSKGARWPASALAVFTTAYAAFAAFVAGMAFSDDWI